MSKAFRQVLSQTATEEPAPLEAAPLLRFAAQSHGPLAQNKAQSFAARYALSLWRQRAIYTLIPKNACSTMRYSIALDNGLISGPEDAGWIHQNFPLWRAELRELVAADYRFTLLRCPYRRIASMFLDKVSGAEQGARLTALHPDRLSRLWFRMKKGSRRITFRSFLEQLARPGNLMAEHHWAPQNAFLIYDRYDDYFRVENMAEAAERLGNRIGLRLEDARPLTRHGPRHLQSCDDGSYADLPASALSEMRRAGQVPSHRALFDAETRTLCAALYREDIALYRAKFGAEALLFPQAN